MIEAILLAAITGGIGIVLTFIFTRNREVTNMAHQVVASTHTYFNVIETLKQVAFIQSQRIDQWETWGKDLKKELNGKLKELDVPDMPDLHLDLRPYWREIDRAIEEMRPKTKKHKDEEE